MPEPVAVPTTASHPAYPRPLSLNDRFTLHSSNVVFDGGGDSKGEIMFRRVPAVIALVAAVLSTALLSADAFARPGHGGGRAGHASFHRGAVGMHRGAVGVRHTAVGMHRGAAVVGYHGALARGGAYRVGGHYHGGVWYGTGRHWWNGRWYPYGVGSCWLLSPIGYVWVCG